MERATAQFIHVPGPNPILVCGAEGTWDERLNEACNVLKDGNRYYLYYHARAKDETRWPRTGYRIGVATAPHPLGPWRKYEGNPIVDLGPEGSWEDGWVACAAVLKEEADRFYMWYSGSGRVGLAYASSPLGPWQKYEANPIISEDFGYVGGVAKVGGKYYMYNEYPVGATSPDQGPIVLAVAEKAEGPWERYDGDPVLPAGDWGAWDDGGYSEAGVLRHDGVFHMFYGGTKWEKFESVGYACSLDGREFIRYPGNPVIPRERVPDCSAMSEVHALWERPFFYVYHTLRYNSKPFEVEHLGVQVLATQRPFRFSMPVATMDSLGPGQVSSESACAPICLENVTSLALTTECAFDGGAKRGLRIHLVASCDGLTYDTEDLCCFDVQANPAGTVRKTVELTPRVMFAKALVENLDEACPASQVNVSATLGG